MAMFQFTGDINAGKGNSKSSSFSKMSLLSSQARIQIPWIKVTIGDYSFGAYSGIYSSQKKLKGEPQSVPGITHNFLQQYPNYIQSLTIKKINGQVNNYSLTIIYPITQNDDPNFFEKVFSSVSQTREIIFSYGDMSAPNYIYKEEHALITGISQSFSFQTSSITYIVSAVSGAALKTDGCQTFPAPSGLVKPSSIIKSLVRSNKSLQNVFTGMAGHLANLEDFIAGDDQVVKLETKTNISVLDYISYLASCMIPLGTNPKAGTSTDIYILTIHDETLYDTSFLGNSSKIAGVTGPYFQVKRTSYLTEQSDAYTIDIGYNTSTIVKGFQINQHENYSLYYDYQGKLNPKKYVRRIGNDGKWEEVYAPVEISKKQAFETKPEDISWWTKATKYPINATITIQGLLRPATLMTHVRLNVIFPGGHKHVASGLYIVTEQIDSISGEGYTTQLGLTKISGDDNITFKTE